MASCWDVEDKKSESREKKKRRCAEMTVVSHVQLHQPHNVAPCPPMTGRAIQRHRGKPGVPLVTWDEPFASCIRHRHGLQNQGLGAFNRLLTLPLPLRCLVPSSLCPRKSNVQLQRRGVRCKPVVLLLQCTLQTNVTSLSDPISALCTCTDRRSTVFQGSSTTTTFTPAHD